MVQLQEFRIVLPFTVEEFGRGMRYSNWKTNEQQTMEGQGGQLLSTSTFYDERYGEGTFSHSVYRLGDRLPDWVTKLVPANALVIDEKTWATFPYLRTVMSCPFFSKLRIEVHSMHIDGDGSEPNALQLVADDLAQRKVDYIDILMDKVGKRDYRADQDPGLVASKLTGIGPLKPGWQKTTSPTMCAYKVVKAYCGYWGVQNRAEKFICKGVRDIFLLTHRNCFCWLDQWHGLTYEQVAQLESFGRQKIKSAVKQPDIIDPKTGKQLVLEDGEASREASKEGDEKVEEDGKAAREKGRKEDPWESGSEAGGAKSSVDEESDDSDMEAEFYEALMEWGSPEDSELESGMALSMGGSRSFSAPRQGAQAETAPVLEQERCQICLQARDLVSRATFFCETCGEKFCAPCFGEWHVTSKLRAHKRSALRSGMPLAAGSLSARQPLPLTVENANQDAALSLPSASPTIPKSPTTARIPLPAFLDRSISAMTLAPAASTKPATESGTRPIAVHRRSISVGSRAVTDEFKDREAVRGEIERLRSNGADLTDVRVAETVLELYDFERPRQPAPWLQEKTTAPLNTPISDTPTGSGRTSPGRSPLSEALGSFSPTLRSPVQISQEMVRAITAVYLLGGQTKQGNGDPYGVRVNHAVDDIGPYEQVLEVLSFKGEAAAMMESKAFLKFRILAELLIDVELRDLRHEEKLAFWINVYNALLMHAYLVNGLPKSHLKRVGLMQRACYHIGGLVYSSLEIEHSILRAQSFRPALAGLLPGHKFKANDPRLAMALKKAEPLVAFALVSGCRSGPALRIYNSDSIGAELEAATCDFLRAAVGFSRRKVLVPKIMHWYAKDFSTDAASLLEWIASKVPNNQAEAIRERVARKKGHASRCMDVQSYQWDFRYLVSQETMQR